MRWDFRHHLLIQIEMLRGDISHEELSKRLGDVTERYLARYIAGKAHLLERDFYQLAKALAINPRVLAERWAIACGLRVPTPLSDKDVVEWIRQRAYRHWRRHSRLAARRVPPSPSPMTVIRAKYADLLPRQTPPLWFNSFGNKKPTREGRRRFARAYEMLVEFVHSHQSQRNVGAIHGLSGVRAAQLMRRAAYTWAKSEGIDLISDKSVPFKNDRKLVKNLYAGLRFFAQQQFDALAAQADMEGSTRWHC
ncbi:MAG: helix-turn-helix domain-containing protein [Edaphobacter sp.]